MLQYIFVIGGNYLKSGYYPSPNYILKPYYEYKDDCEKLMLEYI
jgi:hypothetical protein